MRALDRLSGGHEADIGIELAEASAPKRALRSSLATPKGLGVSDPTATDVRYASKADLALALPNVRLVPITDVCLFRASEPDCELLPLS